MKIKVTGCKDCPLKKFSNGDQMMCEALKELVFSDTINYCVGTKSHPKCPLLKRRVVLAHDINTADLTQGEMVQVFIGNQVLLTDNKTGIVVAKFHPECPYDFVPGGGDFKPYKEYEDKKIPKLLILLNDSIRYCLAYEADVKEVISRKVKDNTSTHFAFYFGDDESLLDL